MSATQQRQSEHATASDRTEPGLTAYAQGQVSRRNQPRGAVVRAGGAAGAGRTRQDHGASAVWARDNAAPALHAAVFGLSELGMAEASLDIALYRGFEAGCGAGGMLVSSAHPSGCRPSARCP